MFKKMCCMLVTLFLSFAVSAETTLILARAPQLSPGATSKTWSPFVNYLSEKTGIKIDLKVYSERSEFESDIKYAKVDLFFGNPGYGIVGHVRHGYLPLIRSDRKQLKGILVAKKTSGIKIVNELDNKVIAFPDRNAFAASLYMRSLLDSDFSINYQSFYPGTHDNVYRAVLIGKAHAGAGVSRTLEREPPRIREQLEIIYTTPGMKSHPIMARPSVPEKIRQSIVQAILDMNKNEEGQKILKAIKLEKPVIADYQKDYQPIESLALKMYQSLMD